MGPLVAARAVVGEKPDGTCRVRRGQATATGFPGATRGADRAAGRSVTGKTVAQQGWDGTEWFPGVGRKARIS